MEDNYRFPIETCTCALCGEKFQPTDKYVRSHSDDHYAWLVYFHRDCWLFYCDHGGKLKGVPP